MNEIYLRKYYKALALDVFPLHRRQTKVFFAGGRGEKYICFLLRFQGNPHFDMGFVMGDSYSAPTLGKKRQWLSLDFGFGQLSTHKAD